MGNDFYEDDYYGGGGGYYDGGGMAVEYGTGDYGGGGWGFDTTSWPTFDEYYGGGGEPIDYAPGFDSSSGFLDLGGGYLYDPSTGGILDTGFQEIPYAPYEPMPLNPYEPSLPDLPFYPGISREDLAFAWEERFAEPIGFESYNRDYFGQYEVIPELPDLPETYFPLPYVPYDYGQLPPYIPPIIEPTPPPPPPLPPSPASSQPNLPPACPGGQYHPYPIGHPQQNACVPFPVSTTPAPQQQPRPSGGASSGGSTSAPKPPSQQQQQPKPAPPPCPPGYYRDPATGQCRQIPQGQPQQCPIGYYRAPSGQCLPIPRCTTPGTVFDAARGICVPQGQAVSPVSPSGAGELGDLFGDLKKLPWWVWLAAGGLLLLGKDDDGGKKTTVTYRRAR
jgi:hypothetical protein